MGRLCIAALMMWMGLSLSPAFCFPDDDLSFEEIIEQIANPTSRASQNEALRALAHILAEPKRFEANSMVHHELIGRYAAQLANATRTNMPAWQKQSVAGIIFAWRTIAILGIEIEDSEDPSERISPDKGIAANLSKPFWKVVEGHGWLEVNKAVFDTERDVDLADFHFECFDKLVDSLAHAESRKEFILLIREITSLLADRAIRERIKQYANNYDVEYPEDRSKEDSNLGTYHELLHQVAIPVWEYIKGLMAADLLSDGLGNGSAVQFKVGSNVSIPGSRSYLDVALHIWNELDMDGKLLFVRDVFDLQETPTRDLSGHAVILSWAASRENEPFVTTMIRRSGEDSGVRSITELRSRLSEIQHKYVRDLGTIQPDGTNWVYALFLPAAVSLIGDHDIEVGLRTVSSVWELSAEPDPASVGMENSVSIARAQITEMAEGSSPQWTALLDSEKARQYLSTIWAVYLEMREPSEAAKDFIDLVFNQAYRRYPPQQKASLGRKVINGLKRAKRALQKRVGLHDHEPHLDAIFVPDDVYIWAELNRIRILVHADNGEPTPVQKEEIERADEDRIGRMLAAQKAALDLMGLIATTPELDWMRDEVRRELLDATSLEWVKTQLKCLERSDYLVPPEVMLFVHKERKALDQMSSEERLFIKVSEPRITAYVEDIETLNRRVRRTPTASRYARLSAGHIRSSLNQSRAGARPSK